MTYIYHHYLWKCTEHSRYCIICTLHFKGNCDFENGLCGWSNIVSNDSFDWSRKQGRTSTVGTGPNVDHTTMTHAGIIFYTLLFPGYLVCLNLFFMGYNYRNKKIDLPNQIFICHQCKITCILRRNNKINRERGLYGKVFAWGFRTEGKYFPVQTEQTCLIRHL